MFKKLLSVVLIGVMALSLAGFNWFGGGTNKASNYSDADFKDYCYCYIDGNDVLHFTSNESKGKFCYGKCGEGNSFLEKNRDWPGTELYNYLTPYFRGYYGIGIEEVTIDDKILINFGNIFHGYGRLKKINNIENIITTDLSSMFSDCESLETLDLNKMDVSHVKTMSSAFYNCNNLKNLNISSWNTSKVEDMSAMFEYCRNLTALNIDKWDVSNVKSMNNMFKGCENLTVLNIENWNVSNVEDEANNKTALGKIMLSGDWGYIFVDCPDSIIPSWYDKENHCIRK